MDWTDCEFVGRDFRDDDLSRLRTERVVFTECDFSGVNLAESEHLGDETGAAGYVLADVARLDGAGVGIAPELHLARLRRDPGLIPLGEHQPYTLFVARGGR